MRFTKEDTEGHLAHDSQHTPRLLQTRSAFAQCLPEACAKACESPKTPSKASDASEWSAPMACVGGTASAARLKRPKSSAQRGDDTELQHAWKRLGRPSGYDAPGEQELKDLASNHNQKRGERRAPRCIRPLMRLHQGASQPPGTILHRASRCIRPLMHLHLPCIPALFRHRGLNE